MIKTNDINYKSEEKDFGFIDVKEIKKLCERDILNPSGYFIKKIEFKENEDFTKGYLIFDAGYCKRVITLLENDIRVCICIGQSEKIKNIQEFNEKCSFLFGFELIEAEKKC